MVQRISQPLPPNADYSAAPFRIKANGAGGTSSPVIQIPASLVVTAAAYREFMDRMRLDEVVEGLLEGVNVKRIEDLYEPATQIKKIVHSAPIAEPLYSSIVEGYQGLGDGAKLVYPVSMPHELLHGSTRYPEFSHLTAADQQEMLEAIKTWWASLFEPTAIFFRELNGQSHRDARIAVAVSAGWIQTQVSF